MNEPTAKEWTLKELAGETGVTERTIRFYISRGLVDPPLRAGRGAAYGEKHRARLGLIRKLQEEKHLMLSEIADALAAEGPGGPPHEMYVRALGAPESRGMLWFEPDGSLDKSQLSDSALSIPEAGAASAPSVPEAEIWRSYRISPDVVVMHLAGVSPWRKKRVLSALRRFAAELTSSHRKEDQGE